VRYVDWHPSTSLLATCSRDATIKLWDVRQRSEGAMLATLKGHKQSVAKVLWNLNGSWLASAGRDQAVCVWDIRHAKRELVSWRGHTRDVQALAWHPIHLELLASGVCARGRVCVVWRARVWGSDGDARFEGVLTVCCLPGAPTFSTGLQC
jgi:polyadenylation factor subunit 2